MMKLKRTVEDPRPSYDVKKRAEYTPHSDSDTTA